MCYAALIFTNAVALSKISPRTAIRWETLAPWGEMPPVDEPMAEPREEESAVVKNQGTILATLVSRGLRRKAPLKNRGVLATSRICRSQCEEPHNTGRTPGRQCFFWGRQREAALPGL